MPHDHVTPKRTHTTALATFCATKTFSTRNVCRELKNSHHWMSDLIILLLTGRRRPTRSPRNILPRRPEPSPRTRKKPLFLVLFGVLFHLEVIQFRCAEQGSEEDGEEDS